MPATGQATQSSEPLVSRVTIYGHKSTPNPTPPSRQSLQPSSHIHPRLPSVSSAASCSNSPGLRIDGPSDVAEAVQVTFPHVRRVHDGARCRYQFPSGSTYRPRSAVRDKARGGLNRTDAENISYRLHVCVHLARHVRLGLLWTSDPVGVQRRHASTQQANITMQRAARGHRKRATGWSR